MSGVARRSLARSGLLLALLFGAFAIRMPTGQAACAAPQTSIDVERADPGQTLQVVGQAWGTECNDTGSCACGGQCTGPGPSPPVTDISIVLVARGRTPGERTILAGGIKANEDLEFTIRVDLADDLPTGR